MNIRTNAISLTDANNRKQKKKEIFIESLYKLNSSTNHDFENLNIVPAPLLEKGGVVKAPKGVQAVMIGNDYDALTRTSIVRRPCRRTRRLYSSRTPFHSLLASYIHEIQTSNETTPETGLEPNYLTCMVSQPQYPPRKFCAVCGYFGSGGCKICGEYYCSLQCQKVHTETR
ncbi:hypothetical protein BB560_002062 [Smittium megazygosporum]|uniref:Uncharacterized protein n=1 Tax=Smittium megazygosporum TaxID=133381 RepID=A0A2T9ZFU3_9FUNG|nr:hypothetical protein BB560_002062 [Smittium megazygosporum]